MIEYLTQVAGVAFTVGAIAFAVVMGCAAAAFVIIWILED